MAAMRFTEFPNLSHSNNPRVETGVAERVIEVGVDNSPHHLAISWAILLRAYTEEQSPIFKINGRSVTVNILDSATPTVQDVVDVQGSRFTGISELKESVSDGVDLLLRYTPNHQYACLLYSRRVSSEQIPHIVKQLSFIIQGRLNLQTKGFPWRLMAKDQLSILNHPPSKMRGPELLHQLVNGPANNDTPALEFQPAKGERQRYSYAQVHNLSNKLASRIQSVLNLPTSAKQEVIPLLIPQSSELYLAVLAVLKAGAAFCPLQLDAPQERIRFIINDISAKIVITTHGLRGKFGWEGGPSLIEVDNFSKGLGTDDSEGGRIDRLKRCEPGDLAYVMYTSGSTGLPKPVGVSHLAATQSLLAHEKHIPRFHRFLQFAAPTFDVFVFEMFCPLYRGGTVVGCDRSELLVNLPAMMNRLDIDAAELTPTVVGTLLRKRSDVPKLKLLLTIGEMLTPPIIDEFGSSPVCEGILHGLYGPTEAAVHCTSASSFSSDFKPGVVGIPLDTVSCLITAIQDVEKPITQDLAVLPRGHVGELVIGGIQLAVGYLNRPEQTASAFVDTQAYGRLYKTGDKARLLPNGVLECLGRIDKAQVKLRGQRIELGEIEQVAYQTKGIGSATAVVVNGIVVLFCVPNTAQIAPRDLTEACRRWLPGFMVPGDICFVKGLPRTPSGKVDRSELQAIYEKKNDAVSLINHDQLDHIDKLVIEAAQELLGPNVDFHADLAAAGLDSLKAIRLASRLRSANFDTGAVDILGSNTLHAIAGSLRRAPNNVLLPESTDMENGWTTVRRKALDELKSILSKSELEAIEDVVPCTSLQTAMLTETIVDNQAYCNWIELQCPGSIDFPTIKAALMLLGLRNEILRTGFLHITDRFHPFVQIVWNAFLESNIVQVSTLERVFQMKTAKALLSPLRAQVQVSGTKQIIVIQIHHALYDGWSWEHIVGDLDMILQSQEIISRPQFRDLVRFYQHPTVSAKSVIAKEYWQNMLQDATPCIFPNLHGKINIQSCLRVSTIVLSTSVTELELASHKLGVGPQAIAQAVFAWLIGVYVADSDIIFGTVSSGRTLPLAGIEEIIGPCMATFPVRLDVGHSRTAQDLILAVHRLSRKMLYHQEISLHEIKKSCGFETNHALFDTLLIWQQTLRNRTPKILLQSDLAEYLEFNLSVEIEPLANHFHVKANYQNAKLPENQVKVFLQQMDQLIALFARNPSTPLAELCRFLGDEVLSIQNPLPERYHSNSTMSHAVEVLAEEDPTRVALEFFQGITDLDVKVDRLSYRSLNEQANQFAHYLLRLGLSQDELVCICLEKSVNLYVGILGIIKAGAGYLPLTPQTPATRRNHILAESRVRFVVSNSFSLDIAAKSDEKCGNDDFNAAFPPSIVVLYTDKIDLISMPVSNPYCSHQSSNLAYAVFTSGTSGVPKGVLVTQANILSNLHALSKIYPVSTESRLLQSCSQAFDVSVFEIFFAWFTGICLCSATQNLLFRDLEAAIRTMRITHLSLTPTVAALVQPENVPKVEFLVTAGEALTKKVFNKWEGKGLFQGYGPSETTNICSVKPFVTAFDNINNLGPPLCNTSAFVMQGPESFDIVPLGGVGEFCFGGDQVFRGYLNMPALNHEKIIQHPKFGRLYRSGDYGRILKDGCLEFYGRKDDQIKIRGQRVELGEINHILLQSAKVIDVFTLIDPRESTSQRLLTFWVPNGHSTVPWHILDDQELSETLQELFVTLVSSLPTYMIPSFLIPIPYMPMTAQGKIDKRRLMRALSSVAHESFMRLARSTTNFLDEQDWSETERMVSQTLCTTIGCVLEQVGRHVSFFSLGLDSVLAISFSRLLREQGFYEADVALVLRHASVSKLSNRLACQPTARFVEDRGTSWLDECFSQDEIKNIALRYDEGRVLSILPCTPLQEAMLSSLDSQGKASYFNHTIFEIHGDIDQLYCAWEKMTSKHDILRTCFTPTENERYSFAQVILSSHKLDWTSTMVEYDDLDTALESCMNKTVRDAIEGKPQYSFTVFQTAKKTVLLLSMHHSLYDGEAFQLLLKDVEATYDGHYSLPPVPSEPFLSRVLSLNLDEADKFWNKHFQNFKPKLLSTVLLGEIGNRRDKSESFVMTEFSSASLQSLVGCCKKLHISMLSLLQASWAKLLSLFLNTTDICFGNVVNGRTLPLDGIERIVAPCFNTIPLRLQLETDLSSLDVIKTAQQFNLNMLPFQFTPLRRIHKLQTAQNSRLFDTLFILQKSQPSLGNHIWSVEQDVGAMDFPFVCEIVPSSVKDALQFNLHTHTDAKLHGYGEKLLKSLDTILNDCLRYPSAKALDFGFLDRDIVTMACATTTTNTDRIRTNSALKEATQVNSVLSLGWTNIQRDILDIVAKLSKHNPEIIEQQTSFFRLGLDSISTAQIAAYLRLKGWNVSPVEVIEYPSISQLSSHLQAKSPMPDKKQLSYEFASYDQKFRSNICLRHEIKSADLENIRPCTAVQTGMLASFLASKGAAYFNSLEVRVPESEQMCDRLRRAWSNVASKYEILRTGFTNVDDAEYPFAMLTYQPGVFDVELEIRVETIDETNRLRERTNLISVAVLHSLHHPPWRVKLIIRKENNFALQIFMHHALFDAHSMKLILHDVKKYYQGEELSKTTSIDFLLNSIILESANDQEIKEIFWRDSISKSAVGKFPNMTTLKLRSSKTYTLEKSCGMPLSEIQARCRNIGVTLQAAGQACWARVLSSYIGETSVIFGTVFSGRSSFEGSDATAFPSVVTIPVCAHLDNKNIELLENFMRSQPNLLKHQFTPLQNVQRWTGRGDEPLFDSIFLYQNVMDHGGELWDTLEENSTADYPISIEFILRSQETGIHLRIVASDDVLPPEQASLLLDQLEVTLSDTLNHPTNHSSNMSLFPEKVLSITPAKEAHIQSPVTTLHGFVEMQAQKTPHRTALEFATSFEREGNTKIYWTYRQLDREGSKIAHVLASMGIKPRSLVAICFRKCPEASFATLGILKAGCAFVAIDPDAPIERQKFIIKDSNSALVLAMADTVVVLQEQKSAPVICLDDIADTLGTISPSSQRTEILQSPQGSDLCYCLYTSGTTGTPKACLITHENAVQSIMAFRRMFHDRWNDDSRFLQFASFHFDVSILEQYWSWSVGICVVSAPRDLILEDIGRAIRELGITHIDLTPSLAKTLHPDDAPSLYKGVFITGGEKLQQEVLDSWGPKGCIFNAYGPTETTIGNTMLPRVSPDEKPSNIGRQFDNVGSYVFRVNTTSAVLRGAVGELCIAGELVGRGYLNKPELTKQKFPYLSDRHERVYRTGDLVRILHDMSFEYLGRVDDQVKLRGQRLEVAEINEVIKQGIHEVQDVATLVIEHKKSQRMQLVSFIVPRSLKRQDTVLGTLKGNAARKMAWLAKEICQGKLPPYMVPTHVIPISAIPLSSNNKVEFKPLKSLYNDLSSKDLLSLMETEDESRTIWTEKESIIVSILARAICSEIDLISRHSNIFRLGLDSISVVNFAHSLKNAGFPGAQVSRVMQSPIIGNLCDNLVKPLRKQNFEASARLLAKQNIQAYHSRHFSTVCSFLKLQPDSVEAIAPCTPLQQGIISRSLISENALYFEEFGYQLSSDIDLARLKKAWANVVASTDVLRIKFCPTVDGHAQAVCKYQSVPWFEKRFDTEEELQAYKFESFTNWRDANKELNGPLFEIRVLHTQARRLVYLRIFHALYDGVSLPVILQAVFLEYTQVPNLKLRPSFMETLAVGPLCEVQGATEFWSQRLLNLTYESELPLTSLRSTTTLATLNVSDPKLSEARRHYNTTLQSLIQAAWILVLRKFFPSEVVFGMVVSGRSIDYENIDQVVGPLFNTIPFYVDISGCKSWADIIGGCHDFNTTVIPYQHSSLRDIMRWCQRSPKQPLFETLFVFQKAELGDAATTCSLWTQMETAPQADYLLSFEALLSKDENSLRLNIVAHDVVSSKENSMEILKEFETALSEITSNTNITYLNTGVSTREPSLASTQYQYPENNKTSRPEASGIDFRWSDNACLIRDEIALLAGCEATALDAQTSIFALGLDSIDAIKLSSRLKRRAIEISVSMIMRNGTISQMAQASKDCRTGADQRPKLKLERYEGPLSAYLQRNGFPMGSIEGVLPPTPLQEAIFADTSTTAFSRYLNQEIFIIRSAVNLRKLEQAWKSVIDQSPILRTRSVAVDDPEIPFSYAQVIHRPGLSCIRHVSVSPNHDVDTVIETVMKHDRTISVDNVPFALTFVQNLDKSHLVLTLSHALYDGISLSMLHTDIVDAYLDRFSSRPSYRDTLEHILNSSNARASQYWIGYIQGAKPCSFLSDLQNSIPNPKVNRLKQRSSASATDIRSFAKSQGISVQAIGQVCWALLVGYYLKTLEVTFGVILSGRDTEQSNEVMLPTMNTVVVRSVIGGSVRQMLQDMQVHCANAIQYQHFPLRKTLAAVKKGSQRLFDSLFLVQRKSAVIANNEKLYESTGANSSVEFPVCVEMELNENTLTWTSACEEFVFDARGMDDLFGNLDFVLEHIIRAPNASAIELSEGGISICGLPAFQSKESEEAEDHSNSDGVFYTTQADEEWNGTESTIRKVLSEVSHIPEGEITKQQTIFNLGLDSIVAIKVSSLLRKRSIGLSVSDMLKATSIFNMAQLANAKQKGSLLVKKDNENPLVHLLAHINVQEVLQSARIDPNNVQKALPCSPGQVYMLSTWQNREGSEFYSTFHFMTSKLLDKRRLNQAWDTLCEKNSIFKTIFVSTGDRQIPFLQIVLKQNPNPAIWLSQPSFHGQLHVDFGKPMVSLAVLSPNVSTSSDSARSSLFLKIHHALYDGVSLDLFMQQLEYLYQDPYVVFESQPQYEDFLAQELTASGQTSRKNFWSMYLNKSDKFLLPLIELAPGYSRYEKKSPFVPGLIPSIKCLSTVARGENVTFQALFLASYAKVHARLLSRMKTDITQRSDIIFGIYLANRSRPLAGLLTLAAPTVNLVPLRIREALQAPILDIAKSIQRDLHLIGSIENSQVGLWEIDDWTGVLIDCFVNFLTLPDSKDNLGSDRTNGLNLDLEHVALDLGSTEYTAQVESEREWFQKSFKWSQENVVKDVYRTSIDIEAAVRNGGLDVGIFYPCALEGHELAGWMMEELKETLECI